MPPMDRPDCFKCRYLVITWDQEFPYACQGMGFKSRRIPWREVLHASGQPCRMFTPKPRRPEED